jgi:transketolase
MQIQETKLKKSTRDAYGEVLLEIGEKFKNVFVMDADLSVTTKTCFFAKKFPERFFDAGIAEQNMMGIAAGLSKTNKTVIVSTLAIFAAGRAFDQVRNTIVHSNCDVKIIATHGGISVGRDGSSHQSIEDIGLMRVIPGMRVIVPCDAVETKKVILKSLDIKGPFYIRLGRENTPILLSDDFNFELGKGFKFKNGRDVTIIGCGMLVYEIIQAADILRQNNISAEIINISSIKPIDSKLIKKSANKTKIVFTCEEHNIIGGLGSAVLEVLETEKNILMNRIGLEDCFGESGTPRELFDKYGLSADKIANRVRSFIKNNT